MRKPELPQREKEREFPVVVRFAEDVLDFLFTEG
jgi:hypothetical protein